MSFFKEKAPHEMTVGELVNEERRIVRLLKPRGVRRNRLMRPSLSPRRAEDILPEAIFAQLWKERQERSPGINWGYASLELILTPEHVGPFSRPKITLTDRDIEVATTVIQWLGTNIGQGFLIEAERRIKLARRAGQVRFHRMQNLGDTTPVKVPEYLKVHAHG